MNIQDDKFMTFQNRKNVTGCLWNLTKKKQAGFEKFASQTVL